MPVKTDEDGIPILEHAVTPEALDREAASGAKLDDPEKVAAFLQNEAVQSLVGDLAEDLQKLVTWKVEAFLKEEMQKLIHEATEQSLSQVQKDIQNQLTLALPELLVKIAQQRGRQGSDD